MEKVLAVVLFMLALFAPIINHVVYCFQTAKYLLLIAGTIVFPVGWFHGVGLFFGWW